MIYQILLMRLLRIREINTEKEDISSLMNREDTYEGKHRHKELLKSIYMLILLFTLSFMSFLLTLKK